MIRGRLEAYADDLFAPLQRADQRARGLLVEWPTGERTPVKYWLSNLPAASGLAPPSRDP